MLFRITEEEVSQIKDTDKEFERAVTTQNGLRGDSSYNNLWMNMIQISSCLLVESTI